MLSFFLTLLGGLPAITRQIADAYAAKQNALTDQERIAADVQIKTLEAKRDVMVAESRSPLNQMMRALYAVPPGIYLAKIYLWDKVLGWGSTDGLTPLLEGVMWTAVSFYFLQDITERWRRR
jgi:hypothetical protein